MDARRNRLLHIPFRNRLPTTIFCRLRLQVQEKGRPYCLELLVCSAQAAVRCNAGDVSATRNELTLLLTQGIKGLHSRYILDCESEAAQGAWIAAVER